MSKILNVILIAILLMVAITACSPEKRLAESWCGGTLPIPKLLLVNM